MFRYSRGVAKYKEGGIRLNFQVASQERARLLRAMTMVGML